MEGDGRSELNTREHFDIHESPVRFALTMCPTRGASHGHPQRQAAQESALDAGPAAPVAAKSYPQTLIEDVRFR